MATVYCVNSGTTYPDIATANAAEAGNWTSTTCILEVDGIDTATSTTFAVADYGTLLIRTYNRDFNGNIGDGFDCLGDIVIEASPVTIIGLGFKSLDTSAVDVVTASAIVVGYNNSNNLAWVINESVDAIYDVTDCLFFGDVYTPSVAQPLVVFSNCTVMGSKGYGFNNVSCADSVSLDNTSDNFINCPALTNCFSDNGDQGTAATATLDQFRDSANGDYRIDPDSILGLAKAGAFVDYPDLITTVGLDASDDFTTIQNALNNYPDKDLVSQHANLRIQVRNDQTYTAMKVTDYNGWLTGRRAKLIVEAMEGHRCSGSETGVTVSKNDQWSLSGAFCLEVAYWEIIGMSLINTNTSGNAAVGFRNETIYGIIDSCRLTGEAGAKSGNGALASGTIYNSLFVNCIEKAFSFSSSADTSVLGLRKCTVIDVTNYGLLSYPTYVAAVLINRENFVTGSVLGDIKDPISNTYTFNNATSDATGDTLTNVDPYDVFVDYDGGDYTIKANSSVGLLGLGAFVEEAGGSAITPDGLYQYGAVEEPTLQLGATLSPVDISQLQSVDKLTLTLTIGLTPEGLTQVQVVEQVGLERAFTITPDSLNQTVDLEAISDLDLTITLTPDELYQAVEVDMVTTGITATIQIDDILQHVTLENTSTGQVQSLNVDDLDQLQTVDGVSLLTTLSLPIDDLYQSVRVGVVTWGAIPTLTTFTISYKPDDVRVSYLASDTHIRFKH